MSADGTEAGPAPPREPATKTPAIHPGLHGLRSTLAVLLTLGSLGWSAQVPGWFGIALFTEQFLSAMLGIALALVYIHYPARRHTERTRMPWYDVVAAGLGFAAGWYVAFAYPVLIKQLTGADLPPDALIVSMIFFVLCIEGLRRTVGYSLVVIVLIFVVYALIGHLVPGDLQTRRVGFGQLITYLSLDTSALMGLAMVVGTTIVLTFVFFGQLLLLSGGSTFFNDLALLLMGRYRGGSAKIAITASSLFGSVSGVAVSNIVATGVVTIPMMKRAGFSPRFAASVEAVASTGGQLMPPVMGAVAFLMADFLEMPYREIVLAALVPSLLYYVALFIQADFEAAKAGITRIEAGKIPKARAVFKTGWMFILPFAGLIVALFSLNWEAEAAAILAAVVIALLFGNWLVFAVTVLLIGLYFALNWNG
ncbi:MAG: TRAP transporter fused permease subunit, partial [Alphaproteobacteria bacterium]|nr:TRAP transporter fused permease subunit [Alphaproteobacteria bacterium]